MRRRVSADFVFAAKAAYGVIGFCGSVASIIALLLLRREVGEALTVFSIPVEYLPWILSVTFAISLSMLLWLIYDFSRRLMRLKQLARDINGIAGTKASTYADMFSDAPHTRNVYSSSSDTPLADLLNHIKVLFTSYTADNCSVCIKILRPDASGTPFVKTLARDSISRAEREQIDKKIVEYPCQVNTAFDQIIQTNSRFAFFLCNNLKARAKRNKYRNANCNWRDYYNACLVVAIAPHDSPELENAIGFLCVDNIRGGFDKDFCAQILLSFGKDVYQIFEVYNAITPTVVTSETRQGKADAAS